jgi:3-phenylpropionate/trans-cinnamate dioxygenase ferredoxin reductase component
MSMEADVLIVGGGQAGAQAASELRTRQVSGRILVVESQQMPPYARPPLSKELLAGKSTIEELLFRSGEYWSRNQIELLLGETVEGVDPDARRVSLASGLDIGYRCMLWSAGGRPRKLDVPGERLDGIFAIRTVADIAGLRGALDSDASPLRVVIVGGGYIGLETAAVLRSQGHSVTVVELAPRLLARVTGDTVSGYFLSLHQDAGNKVLLGERVQEFHGSDGRVSAVVLASGARVPADVVVVGVGMEPNMEPLVAAGAAAGLGIEVDELCRTSLPSVYAAGDCVSFVSKHADGKRIRLESVQNAVDQATAAASAIAGSPKPNVKVPWFWSHQYDVKLLTAGLSYGYDTTIVRGTPESGSFSVAYLRGETLLCLDAVNKTRDYVQARWLIERGGKISSLRMVADDTVPLKQAGEAA